MAKFKLRFEAIGTIWEIDCFESSASKKKIESLVKNRIEDFDITYSRFRKDSLIWKISEKAGDYKFPEDSNQLFLAYNNFYQITDGAFTPLIGSILAEAGYDEEYSLNPKKINKVPAISKIYSWNYPILKVKKPHILELGGLGKGYLVDIISGILKGQGIESFIVDAGGDMYIHNLEKPLKVGLENPTNNKQVIGVIELNNKSICASSGNRRKWGNFHHIINPKTLASNDEILSTWVIASDTITADGIATSLFLVSPKKLSKYYKFEYLILDKNLKFKKSKNFSAELFLK